MPQFHLLRVFCADDGSHGNPLGVFADGAEVPPARRQAVAADLALSEVVFVDDAERGVLRIFTPAVELDFGGHPAVGAAWLLDGVEALRTPAGEVAVTRDDGVVFVAARPAWGPPFELAELGSPEEVEALDGPPGGQDLIAAWAWIDEAAGTMPPERQPPSCARSSGAGSTSARAAGHASWRAPAPTGSSRSVASA